MAELGWPGGLKRALTDCLWPFAGAAGRIAVPALPTQLLLG